MPEIFRKRLIPNETIHLSDDTILYTDDSYIITSWQTLRPKATFSHGVSCYCQKEGWKISRFYSCDGNLLYIYCDIIETFHDESTNSFIFEDLLADVIIENDGRVRVIDLDELGDAISQGIMDIPLIDKTLKRLDSLLKAIEDGSFKTYLDFLDKHITG